MKLRRGWVIIAIATVILIAYIAALVGFDLAERWRG